MSDFPMSSRAKFLKRGALLATSAVLLTNCSEATSQPNSNSPLPSTAGRVFDFSSSSLAHGTRGAESVSSSGNGTLVLENSQSTIRGTCIVAGMSTDFYTQWKAMATTFRIDVNIGKSAASIFSELATPSVGIPQKTTYSDGSILTRTISNAQNGSGIFTNAGGQSWSLLLQVNGDHLVFSYDGATSGSLVAALSGTNVTTTQRDPLDVSNCQAIARIGYAFEIAAYWGSVIFLPGDLIVGGIGLVLTGYGDLICR